jgi:adenosylcobinamide-phosphate synthase
MVPFGLFGGGAMDPLLLLLIALALDALLGDPPWLFRIIPHPVRIIGVLIDRIETKINREKRNQMDRAFRGFGLLLFMLTFSIGIGLGVQHLSATTRFGWLLELFLVFSLLAQRGLFDAVRAVALALKKEGLAGGRKAVSQIVGRDVERLDAHGVSRAAIESCVENFGDGVVAPIFWYVLFGLPGMLAYKTVNTLDSMVGHKSERFRAFGSTSARLDDVLNFIPARLAGLLLILAAFFVPTARPFRGLKVMLRDSRKHRSPNAGWPEAATAGALGLALSGPRAYAEGASSEPWLGEEFTAKAEEKDIRRALYLFAVACLLNAALVAAFWVLRLGINL